MQDNQEKPNVDEQYARAINASNLRVETDASRRSQADILVASAWSSSRIGAILMRLHTEYQGSQHPRRLSKDAVHALALTIDVPKDSPPSRKTAIQLAKAWKTADDWYGHEVGLLLSRMKSLPAVRQQLAIKATEWRSDQPLDLAISLLIWWLDRVCPVCHGTKWDVAPGTGRHNGRVCNKCKGTGEVSIPCGQDGRRMANFIDDCVLRWLSSTRRGLRESAHHG